MSEVCNSTARQRLRAVHDQQVDALVAFTTLEGKAAKLRMSLAAVEVEQRLALAELAELAGVELAGQLTQVSAARVREALAERRRLGDDDAAAAHSTGKGVLPGPAEPTTGVALGSSRRARGGPRRLDAEGGDGGAGALAQQRESGHNGQEGCA